MPAIGRPPEYSDDLALALCQLLADGVPRKVACESCRVGYSTFKGWLTHARRNPDSPFGPFLALVMESEAVCHIACVKTITGRAKLGDEKCAQWWLERRYPDEYGSNRGKLLEVERRLRAIESAAPPAGAG